MNISNFLDLSSNVNTVGLVLDIIGVIIIFRHGIPPSIDEGHTEIMPKELEKKHRKKSKLGIILILIGFLIQIISNYISN
jgi:hypothetical protein